MLVRDWDAHKVANVAKEKKRGWKEGAQALYRVYLVHFPYLELFTIGGETVPYLEPFWVKPVKKHPVYYMFDRRTDGRVQFGGILILLPPLACRPSLSVQSPNEQKPAELSVNL